MQLNAFRVSTLALALAGGLFASNDVAACTTDGWLLEGSVTGSPTAGSPNGVKRYSGICGMQAALTGTSFVTNNSPNGTTDGTSNPYRARFYVFTGVTAATPEIFSATSADGGGGTPAVSISRTATGFSFTAQGASVGSFTEAAGATAFNNKWYAIEIFYQEGQPFTASVRGNRATAETALASAGNMAGGVPVGSARLGVINAAAATTALAFDDFESTRSAATAIGRLCPGDADGGGSIGASDAIAIGNDFSGTRAAGQPDCTEDGLVNVNDAICVANRFAVTAQRTCSQN